MAVSLLVSAWLVGALGGLHCANMCGGFIAVVAGRDARARNTTTILPAATIAKRHLGYHAAHLASYAMLGAAFGGAGTASMDAIAWAPLRRPLYVDEVTVSCRPDAYELCPCQRPFERY